MFQITRQICAAIILLWCAKISLAAGHYVEVDYPPSNEADELQFGVTYTIWLPDGVERLRGVIVHQHGCGAGACKGGETAAYDLHWQALASKWECGLLGPSYHQEDGQNCRLWCDPRNGSEKAFLQALADLAEKARHPELKTAPWCLWGHSGGAFWASLMQAKHPERIVAIWLRSGTAYSTWEKGEIPKPDIPDAAFQIPVMCNPGAKEQGDKRFNVAYAGAMEMFQAYRAKGAPIGFAADPRTAHECGDSRYLAIPFFDACLAMRLPDKQSRQQTLQPVNQSQAWLADTSGAEAVPAASHRGEALKAGWLPNERVAKAWMEYVKTGAVNDATPPPFPTAVTVAADAEGGAVVTWDAVADFESGLQAFVVLRDGEQLGQVPDKPIGRFGRPLFQTMSYHDTPEKPLPEMRFVDSAAKPGERHEYRVMAVNSVGLRSEPSEAGRLSESTASSNDGQPRTLLNHSRRIVFLGDSITAASHYVAYFEAWLAAQRMAHPPAVIDCGLPSETVSGLSEEGHADGRFPRPDLAERLKRVLAVAKPDLVFACYGMNCAIYQPFDEERFKKYQQGIERLKSQVESSGARLVLITPPFHDDQQSPHAFNYNQVLDRYSEWLLDRRSEGWQVIDLHGPMTREVLRRRASDPKFTFQPDGVHPSEEGHWFIASQLIGWFGDTTAAQAKSPDEMLAAKKIPAEVLTLVEQRVRLLENAYVAAARHKRPGVAAGLPIPEAESKARELTAKMDRLMAK